MREDHLLDVLDRRAALALDSEGRTLVVEARRFVNWVLSDITFGSFAVQLVEEMNSAIRKHRSDLERTIDALETLCRESERDIGPLGVRSATAPASPDAPERGLPQLLSDLRACSENLTEQMPDIDEEQRWIFDNLHLLDQLLGDEIEKTASTRASELQLSVRNLTSSQFALSRDYWALREASAGFSLVCVKQITDTVGAAGVSPDDRGHEIVDGIQTESVLAQHYADLGRPNTSMRESTRLKSHIRRVHVELRALIGTSLSHRQLIGRFKARSVWYDRRRLRSLVLEGGHYSRRREHLLVEELARFLFDNGVWVLTRVGLGHHELDLLGARGRPLLVEGKAYVRPIRNQIVKGIAQLHAYMVNVEGTPWEVDEAHYVVFRLNGRMYDLPAEVQTSRYRIHTHLIDLGESADSGREQPAPDVITKEELLAALTSKTKEKS
jgi:hypothetical protein